MFSNLSNQLQETLSQLTDPHHSAAADSVLSSSPPTAPSSRMHALDQLTNSLRSLQVQYSPQRVCRPSPNYCFGATMFNFTPVHAAGQERFEIPFESGVVGGAIRDEDMANIALSPISASSAEPAVQSHLSLMTPPRAPSHPPGRLRARALRF
ncbi:hypothetical protein CALVIDRAFT_565122 [Calocera viscosa TUFC12733]|uniref:Uncharacterized protein n=1 Tax=Calocera viscosa (strain TUFC12733) TaxID=1330018 RepID=A0A167KU86_CALVF|nr:hypothetical protein CALVIDRAFT_565122 [Calocera viscosa TUFC12733]